MYIHVTCANCPLSHATHPQVSEIFGTRAFASVYGFFTLAVTSSSLLLSAQLASSVYEAHTPPLSSSIAISTCEGDACYRLTHLVVGACCLLGGVTAGAVSTRTRTFYRGNTG